MNQATTREIKVKLNRKQRQAFRILRDNETEELLYGGGAGGGKTRLGCLFGLYMSMNYEGIRGAFAREVVKDLKESTLLTFFEVCAEYGFRKDIDYVYHTDSHIEFVTTGSTIYLKELKYYPSDPNYDYLGSMEYTWGFIDEAQQITDKAKNIFLSRIRYKLDMYNLMPKLLMGCNPAKGFLYSDFYRPSTTNALPKHRKFIQALPSDNPFLPHSYIEMLSKLDKQTRERQLYGNWDYDDDPAVLCDYDAIVDMFSNIIKPTPKEQELIDKMKGYDPSDSVYQSLEAQLKLLQKKYIVADIARFGDDRTVVSYWEGWKCKRIASYTKMPLVPDMNRKELGSVAEIITEWRKDYGVGLSNTLVDEDGLGGGVKDYLGCRGFMANRAPIKQNGKTPNYANLKAQCGYYLADRVNGRMITVQTTNSKIREYLTEEMGYLKAWNRDKDAKIAIMPKDEIKKKLGRSPDFSDVLVMRAYFDLMPVPRIIMLNV